MAHPVDSFLLRDSDELAWETFHENSKTSRHGTHPYFGRHPSDSAVVAMMRRLREVKPYTDRPHLPLPGDYQPSVVSLEEALLTRTSARTFGDGSIGLESLAAILRCGYGVTRDNRATNYPRPFRAVPSGGALYPLELYVVTRRVDGLDVGLYHYDPIDSELDVLGPADLPNAAFVQGDLVASAAAVLLVSAVFLRSTFKYGDRGYRFVLLEAGHVVQNAVLAAHGRRIGAVPLGGYFDREVDGALGLDGIEESVVYTLLLGPVG